MWTPSKRELEEWDDESTPNVYTPFKTGIILGSIGLLGVLAFWVYPLYCAFRGQPKIYFLEEMAFGSLVMLLLGIGQLFNFQLIHKLTRITVFDLLRIVVLTAVSICIFIAYGSLINSFANVQCDALPREMFPAWF